MALLNTLDLDGLAIANAYWRVGSFEWNTNEPGVIRLRLDCYASQDVYQSGRSALRSISKELQLDPSNPQDDKVVLFSQIRATCYAEVKEMSEFQEAIDV